VYLTSLHIHVSIDRYSETTGRTRDWSSPKYHSPTRRHYEDAIKCFTSLKSVTVRRGSKLRLSFLVRPNDTIHKLVEVLAPFVYDMKEKGWNVVVDGVPTGGLGFGYDIIREDWDERIKTESLFVSTPSQHHWRSYDEVKLHGMVTIGRLFATSQSSIHGWRVMGRRIQQRHLMTDHVEWKDGASSTMAAGSES